MDAGDGPARCSLRLRSAGAGVYSSPRPIFFRVPEMVSRGTRIERMMVGAAEDEVRWLCDAGDDCGLGARTRQAVRGAWLPCFARWWMGGGCAPRSTNASPH